MKEMRFEIGFSAVTSIRTTYRSKLDSEKELRVADTRLATPISKDRQDKANPQQFPDKMRARVQVVVSLRELVS